MQECSPTGFGRSARVLLSMVSYDWAILWSTIRRPARTVAAFSVPVDAASAATAMWPNVLVGSHFINPRMFSPLHVRLRMAPMPQFANLSGQSRHSPTCPCVHLRQKPSRLSSRRVRADRSHGLTATQLCHSGPDGYTDYHMPSWRTLAETRPTP